jgi:cyclopropane-fatty-acyl-phospholipid synthase
MSAEHSVISPRLYWRSNRLTTRLLQRYLPHPAAGSLRIETPAGDRIELRAAAEGPEATLCIERWRCLWRLATAGEVGFAEAYIDGDWTTPDLTQLLAWALRNEERLTSATKGPWVSRLAGRLAHALHANTKRGSRRNIAAHYDLGNKFYERWLDRGMSYSSALFTDARQSLEAAQEAKLDRIISLLDIRGGEDVLEIGFGWGGVLERLNNRHDCKIIGLTLSIKQLAYATERLAKSGLGRTYDLRLQDYRDVGGKFDRIVSIEMLEAVGENYWPTYFTKLRDCLKPSGTCVLQTITIAEDRFDTYRKTPDFIQRHIFPGGMLPTKSVVRHEAERAGLATVEQDSFGMSYAQTLHEWRRRFIEAWPKIETLGFDARFRRMWNYYLAYCEVGFLGGAVDVTLFKLRG